jgi:hypothetical protein
MKSKTNPKEFVMEKDITVTPVEIEDQDATVTEETDAYEVMLIQGVVY